MAARGRRSSGAARLLVLVGIVAVLGGTFLAGVYAGRIWSARAAVVAAHAPETEPARRGPGRGGRLPEAPAPQLTFYRELTAPLTAPPPPPRPAKTAPPPLVTVPPRPGEQADTLGAASRSPPPATTRAWWKPTPTARSTACRSVTSPRARPRARWRCASAASGR